MLETQELKEPARRKTCLIVARDSNDVKPVLLHALEAANAQIVIFSDHHRDDADPLSILIEYLRNHEIDRLVVVGGDGTLRLAVHALHALKRATPILLVPSGTANDFARTLLELEPSLAESDRPLLDCPLDCDVGQVRKQSADSLDKSVHYFVNMMVIGGGAENSLSISRDLKRIVGAAAYLTQLYHSLVEVATFHVRIQSPQAQRSDSSCEALDLSLDCSAIFIANGRSCGGGYSIAPHAEPSDGWLDVVIVKDISIWGKLALAASFLSDQHLENEAVMWLRVKQIQLSFQDTQPVTLDGECIEADQVAIALQHHSQRIGVFPTN